MTSKVLKSYDELRKFINDNIKNGWSFWIREVIHGIYYPQSLISLGFVRYKKEWITE